MRERERDTFAPSNHIPPVSIHSVVHKIREREGERERRAPPDLNAPSYNVGNNSKVDSRAQMSPNMNTGKDGLDQERSARGRSSPAPAASGAS